MDQVQDIILARVRHENPDIDVDYSYEIFKEALILIEDKCDSFCSLTLALLRLHSPVRNQTSVLHSDYLREISFNKEKLRAFLTEKRLLQKTDRNQEYQVVMDAVDNGYGSIIFLQAPGGTGETFLTNFILAEIRSSGEKAVAVASSGIAATLDGRWKNSSFYFSFSNRYCKTGNPLLAL